MRYMLMVYEPEDTPAEPPSPEAMAASYAAHGAYYGELAQRGIVQVAERLRPTALATTVRVKDGQVLVTDGPFAETKERLGGINIFECKDLDEAIELAARFPTVAAGHGCMEIRPIWEASAEEMQMMGAEPPASPSA
jgi:hypothetical protein